MPDAPVLRSVAPGEAAAVLELWRRAEAKHTTTDDLRGVQGLLAHDAAALVVAEVEGEIVGSVIAAWDGWRGTVYRLAVDPTQRRRGIARALLAEAERRLARRGVRRLGAIVDASDAQALGFWRASGWAEQVENRRFVRDQPPAHPPHA